MVGRCLPDLLVPYFILLSAAGPTLLQPSSQEGSRPSLATPINSRLKEAPELIGNAVEEMMRW
jgi:hypothetical protein